MTRSGPPAREDHQLALRAPVSSDVGPLFEIQGDAHAMRFTYCAASPEATREFLEAHAARFAQGGYAPWDARLQGGRPGRRLGRPEP